jgi:hypothetical protein
MEEVLGEAFGKASAIEGSETTGDRQFVAAVVAFWVCHICRIQAQEIPEYANFFCFSKSQPRPCQLRPCWMGKHFCGLLCSACSFARANSHMNRACLFFACCLYRWLIVTIMPKSNQPGATTIYIPTKAPARIGYCRPLLKFRRKVADHPLGASSQNTALMYGVHTLDLPMHWDANLPRLCT